MALSLPYIHQVFLDTGQGQLEDWPLYVSNMQKTRALYAERHKIWRDSDVQELLIAYPQFDELVRMFPNRFWLVDFARLMILDYCCRTGAHGGGFATYVDLDEKPRETFLLKSTDFILGGDDDGAYNNNILHVPETCSSRLLDFAAQQASRILATRSRMGHYYFEGNGLLHAVGPFMLRCYLLRWPTPVRSVNDCFYRTRSTAAWRNVADYRKGLLQEEDEEPSKAEEKRKAKETEKRVMPKPLRSLSRTRHPGHLPPLEDRVVKSARARAKADLQDDHELSKWSWMLERAVII